MKEWRDWCTIVYNWEGEWTTFCSNNYCTQLSLVLIAHNQSVQDSETWKCTVPVFVQFKYTQGKYLKRQTLYRCAVKKSGWDRSDINIRERQEMQSRNYRQGFFVRPPFTHHQLKLNSFQDSTIWIANTVSHLDYNGMTNRSKVPGGRGWNFGGWESWEGVRAFTFITSLSGSVWCTFGTSEVENISSVCFDVKEKVPLKGNAK